MDSNTRSNNTLPVRYMVGRVTPQFEGVTWFMAQPEIAKEVLGMVIPGYTVFTPELGVIRESILAGSLGYNRN